MVLKFLRTVTILITAFVLDGCDGSPLIARSTSSITSAQAELWNATGPNSHLDEFNSEVAVAVGDISTSDWHLTSGQFVLDADMGLLLGDGKPPRPIPGWDAQRHCLELKSLAVDKSATLRIVTKQMKPVLFRIDVKGDILLAGTLDYRGRDGADGVEGENVGDGEAGGTGGDLYLLAGGKLLFRGVIDVRGGRGGRGGACKYEGHNNEALHSGSGGAGGEGGVVRLDAVRDKEIVGTITSDGGAGGDGGEITITKNNLALVTAGSGGRGGRGIGKASRGGEGGRGGGILVQSANNANVLGGAGGAGGHGVQQGGDGGRGGVVTIRANNTGQAVAGAGGRGGSGDKQGGVGGEGGGVAIAVVSYSYDRPIREDSQPINKGLARAGVGGQGGDGATLAGSGGQGGGVLLSFDNEGVAQAGAGGVGGKSSEHGGAGGAGGTVTLVKSNRTGSKVNAGAGGIGGEGGLRGGDGGKGGDVRIGGQSAADAVATEGLGGKGGVGRKIFGSEGARGVVRLAGEGRKP